MNPYEKKYARLTHGTKAEKRLGKRIGGKMRPGSGNVEGAKGDVVLPDFLTESKATIHDSIRLEREWLRKITREALSVGRCPALVVQFVDVAGRPAGDAATWAVIPEYLFREIIDVVRAQQAPQEKSQRARPAAQAADDQGTVSKDPG